MTLNKSSRIFIAGHNGMVGSSILRIFKKKKYQKIFTINRKELDLLDQKKTYNYLKEIKPDFVIIAAAKVGGIWANQNYKAEFIYENLLMQSNLIHGSYLSGVKKLIFLASSCIYPRLADQPIKESYLLDGKLEPTNDAYAIAKIAGIKMCEAYNQQYKLNYLSLMPTNMYGPNDNYDLENSHFFPALIKKIYHSKINKKNIIKIWGNGKAKRELMFVDDLANACEFFLKKKVNHTIINIGSGQEKTILGFCKYIMKKLNCNFKIELDTSKPNGTPRKILDCTLAKSYGWRSKYSLEQGFKVTFQNYINKNLFVKN